MARRVDSSWTQIDEHPEKALLSSTRLTGKDTYRRMVGLNPSGGRASPARCNASARVEVRDPSFQAGLLVVSATSPPFLLLDLLLDRGRTSRDPSTRAGTNCYFDQVKIE
jgi:hypothetical protein